MASCRETGVCWVWAFSYSGRHIQTMFAIADSRYSLRNGDTSSQNWLYLLFLSYLKCVTPRVQTLLGAFTAWNNTSVLWSLQFCTLLQVPTRLYGDSRNPNSFTKYTCTVRKWLVQCFIDSRYSPTDMPTVRAPSHSESHNAALCPWRQLKLHAISYSRSRGFLLLQAVFGPSVVRSEAQSRRIDG
jgi:hypothetical protein